MTNKQNNKLAMYVTVQQVCKTHEGVWNNLPIAVNLFAEFEGKIKLLQAASQKQERVQTGITLDKNQLRDALIEKVTVMAAALSAYGSIQQNNELVNRVNYNASDLQRTKELLLKEKAEIALEEVKKHLPNLADYGVKEPQVNELEGLINTFAAKIGSPRVAITERKEATTNLVELFKDVDDLLKNKFDKLMLQFQKTAFYTTYQAARIIVDRRPKTKERVVKEEEV